MICMAFTCFIEKYANIMFNFPPTYCNIAIVVRIEEWHLGLNSYPYLAHKIAYLQALRKSQVVQCS